MKKLLMAASMVAFAGTCSVYAAPMTRRDYNDYRGWRLPDSEDGGDAGYIIEDREGQKNTEQLDGFVQWLPEDEFNRKFKLAPANHIERMQVEKQELDNKLNALKGFLAKLDMEGGPLLTDEQINSLELQAEAMEQYSNILGSRIEYDVELIAAISN